MATLGWIALAVNLHFATAADTAPRAVEHQYILSARVRPLVVLWIRRDNVGAGRVRWANGAGEKSVELVIGSDPDRVPMRINRWGYIGEFHRPGEADVIGVMTETEETSVEQARRNLDRRGATHVYRCMRTSIRDGQSATALFGLAFPEAVTYRAVDNVRRQVEERTGTARQVPVPAGTDHGFLLAVWNLVDTSVTMHRAGAPQARLKRDCVYANMLYEVRLESAKSTVQGLLESEFAVLNRATGKTTRFQMTYGVDTPLAGVPVRIVFRPNWWFEAELNLVREGDIRGATVRGGE
ncbi:MAG: hypothetical protein JNK48_27935 [Bryobacterales bacterium]|nr:hypothetical protein [Bryobacterales bacterium]